MEFKISKVLIQELGATHSNKTTSNWKFYWMTCILCRWGNSDDELDFNEATYILSFRQWKTAEILLEWEDDLRENILSRLSPKEIAEELDELKPMMRPILLELRKIWKPSNIWALDVEHAKDIVDLLRYDEDTAGGIMHKELVRSMKIECAHLCKRNANTSWKHL
jgi:magnesium transporter